MSASAHETCACGTIANWMRRSGAGATPKRLLRLLPRSMPPGFRRRKYAILRQRFTILEWSPETRPFRWSIPSTARPMGFTPWDCPYDSRMPSPDSISLHPVWESIMSASTARSWGTMQTGLRSYARKALSSNIISGMGEGRDQGECSINGGPPMPRENVSRYLIALLCCAVICALMAPSALKTAAATSPQDLVNAAYAAMGGDKLKTITLRASLQQFDPGESYSVSDPAKPDTGVSELVHSRDFEREFVRNEWVRPKADDGMKRTYTEIITEAGGYVIGNDATNGRLPKRTVNGNQPEHTMSGRRLTATIRELERPFIVLEMKRHSDRVFVIDDQKVSGKTYPAAQYRDAYGTFIVMFDPATKLPARVRTLDWDALEGDSAFDAEYSDWRDVSGVKIAFLTQYTLNGMKVADLKLSSVMVNPTLPPKTFDIPQAMVAAAAKPAPANATPFQWIIRRQYSGFYYDSDKKYTDDLDSLKLVDVAPNVSQTQGGTHNTLFIATNSYLIAVEAPNDDGQAIQSIEMAKKKYPGKPIRYLILTHHHVDHVSGMRTYAAEGATIVVSKGDGDS